MHTSFKYYFLLVYLLLLYFLLVLIELAEPFKYITRVLGFLWEKKEEKKIGPHTRNIMISSY